MDITPIYLREVLSNAIDVTYIKAQEKGIQLELDYPDTVVRHVMGDKTRLRQIVVNLVCNAIKFTPTSKVTVRAASQMLDSGHAQIGISIADTGIGIPADKLYAIFEQFSQAESSTTAQYGGTVLGLTICRALTILMGGSITVQSEVGKGSIFKVQASLETVNPPSPAKPVA